MALVVAEVKPTGGDNRLVAAISASHPGYMPVPSLEIAPSPTLSLCRSLSPPTGQVWSRFQQTDGGRCGATVVVNQPTPILSLFLSPSLFMCWFAGEGIVMPEEENPPFFVSLPKKVMGFGPLICFYLFF